MGQGFHLIPQLAKLKLLNFASKKKERNERTSLYSAKTGID